jgi:poly-gamma-glutamate capsule biosynthesis protein CapA/YwtB (metallophosphatase superfamily)
LGGNLLKTNKLLTAILFLLLALLLAACSLATGNAVPKKERFETRKEPVAIAPAEITKTATASLSAIGDVLIHDSVYLDAQTKSGYDFNPMFQKVKPYLETAGITVANSESIIGGSEIGVSTYPSFNSPFEVGDALKNAGVDVVTMANNHTLDRGEKAVANAINYWDRIGIAHTGAALSEKERDKVITQTQNGITFSFLSYTYGTNGIPTPGGKEYLVNRIDKTAIQQDLALAKQQSDVAVVSLHFGQEYERMPNDEQKDLARFAAENGADIILGSHPHVLQPVEWIETADGRKSFVIYSLGNFLSHQNELHQKIGGILHINVKKTVDADKTTIELKDPAFTATYVRNNHLRDFEIDLLKDADPEAYKDTKQHMTKWMPDLKFE